MLYGLHDTGISGQGFWNIYKITHKSNLFYGCFPHQTIQHQLLLVITILPPSFAFPRQRSQGPRTWPFPHWLRLSNIFCSAKVKCFLYLLISKGTDRQQAFSSQFLAELLYKHYKVILLANLSTKYFLLNWNDPHCKKFWSVNVVDRRPVFAKLRAIRLWMLAFK